MFFSSVKKFQTRLMNFFAPTTPVVLQGLDTSSGPMNISYSRRVSAPYSRTTSLGFTTNSGKRLPILMPFSPRIMP